MTSVEIRQQFLNFFKSKGHLIVPSAPIVVKNDPTLLFTNAGMNQFKDYFLGNKHPEHKRVADTQKCLRVSGKHNDLEEVGVDTYHHTMFEMLGNWSFGDYFKKEAIAWSWELLTEVYQLDKDRLYVTIFKGDENEGLAKDEEAYNEWKKYVPEDRILLGNKKDNFWEMGDTGPCGPCTEIHYDSRSEDERKSTPGAVLVNADHPQVIEIWNNVFMQFNRLKGGILEPLPAKHVDTGMGFERLVRVIQGAQSNYDTDVFTGTIAEVEKITGKQYDGSDSKQAVAFRVLADHIRAIAFTIADGQLPSNTGAGYVIRRILRRAVRYYYSYLDYKQPLLFQMMLVLAKQFENVFSELEQQLDFVSKLVRREEEMFLKTLEYGLRRFNTYTDLRFGNTVIVDYDEDVAVHFNIKEKYWQARARKEVAGEFAFELNDTFGFPIDLTKLIASEKGFTVDEVGFEKALQKQKDRSRAATALETGDWAVLKDADTKFVGYDNEITTTEVTKYRRVKTKGKEYYQIVLELTPFYAESGGQVGDTGELCFEENNVTIPIIDTKKENDLIIHFAESIPKDLTGNVVAKVNSKRRKLITLNHSATHLMHAALRQVLGTHVAQKGSLVNDTNLRFDFSHFSKVTNDEIKQVESIVNNRIRENIKVEIKLMNKEEAIELGAMALFGEKYRDEVRVVIMDFDFSKELCGGIHVHYTGEIGFFKIKQESSVATGVRRIEAVTGKAAEDYIDERINELDTAKTQLNNPQQLNKAIEVFLTEQQELKRKLESAEAKLINKLIYELMSKKQLINGNAFIGEVVEISSIEALKKLRIDLNKKLDGVVVLCGSFGDRVEVPIAISETLAAKGLDANKIVKEKIGPLVKGGGGGSKTQASAGGQDSSNFGQVIEQVKALL